MDVKLKSGELIKESENVEKDAELDELDEEYDEYLINDIYTMNWTNN